MDPTLISKPVENQWVVEITKILEHQIEINREIPSVSIFHLPECITTKKPEAYEPQRIGLGPIHHFRPGPYRMMEQLKLLVARKQLKESKIENGKVIVLNKVRQLVPLVRPCYNIFLQDDDESLAWIFAIDGLFLLNLFQTYNTGMGENKNFLYWLKKKVKEFQQRLQINQNINIFDCESSDFLDPLPPPEKVVVTSKNRTCTTRRKLVQDIMMVGNQIPFMVLNEINEGLHPSSGSFSPSEFRIFCEIHSPLKLCPESQAPTNNVEHVLDYMYYSILNNCKRSPPLQRSASSPRSPLAPLRRSSPSLPPPTPPPPPPRPPLRRSASPGNINAKMEEIVQMFDKTVSILETFTQTRIHIPPASKLHDKAGFMFHTLENHEGIQNIYNKDNDIYLPCLTLNNDSEVILRNLIAYETLTANPDKFPLTEYMGLMCALIGNVDDVKYLRDQKVIDGEMGNDEVAKLFIGMSTSIQPIKTEKKSDLQKMIDEVNRVYNDRLEMKMHLHLQKLAGWLLAGLKAIGKFVENSWKIVAFMISIVTVFMLTYQAYCDVYGCDKKAVTLLPYASS